MFRILFLSILSLYYSISFSDNSISTNFTKIYLNANQIVFNDNKIFVDIDNSWIQIDRLESDDEGIYLTGWNPSVYWTCPHCENTGNSP